jgi:hypothetical protein
MPAENLHDKKIGHFFIPTYPELINMHVCDITRRYSLPVKLIIDS